MKKTISLGVYIILILVRIYSVSFESGLKLEANGQIELAIAEYKDYFRQNVNSSDQEKIIDELVHVSSIFKSLEESIEFLESFVIYMSNPISRSIIYRVIGNIYELNGNIYLAGTLYEKSYKVYPKDLTPYLYSLEMLVEIGYQDLVIEKLKAINTGILNDDHKNYIEYLLCRSYLDLNDINGKNILNSSKQNPYLNYLRNEIPRDSIYHEIKNSKFELLTPSYFIKKD